jgi:hypothetical protein
MGSLLSKPTKYRLANGFSSKSRLIKESIMSTQVVLVTGGLTGVGRAAAVAKKGAKVVSPVGGKRPATRS